MPTGISTHFFLGANSPTGFYSLYDWLIDLEAAQDVYILKGGAGCGKSSFMRYIAAKMIDCGADVEYIHCSSDPDSLDGIVIAQLGTAFVDGTSPHVVEPKYPAVVESYINLGDYYNREALKLVRNEIIDATTAYKAGFPAAYRCLSAARSLSDECYAIASGAVDFRRLAKRCKGISQREFKKTGRTGGNITKRFLSAVTPNGYMCDFTTVDTMCSRVYELASNYGLARFMMSAFQKAAVENGYDVIACYDPLYPDESPEHVLIPELKLGFVTSTGMIPYGGSPYRRILLDNMIDKSQMKATKTRLRFSRKMVKSLIDEAVSSLALSKSHHDKLEAIYNPFVDFDGIYELADKMSWELMARLS